MITIFIEAVTRISKNPLYNAYIFWNYVFKVVVSIYKPIIMAAYIPIINNNVKVANNIRVNNSNELIPIEFI